MRTLVITSALAAALAGCTLTPEPLLPPEEQPVMVAILWHQHQPHYLQDETGEYAYPWVRVHATKDYCDMVTILEDHPGMKFTVNLTPVLINQLEDLSAKWEAGEPTDAFVRHALLDADNLTDDEKRFLLMHFFSLNWNRILTRFPRYIELRDMRPDMGSEESIRAALRTWTAQDFRDLQMLFNLGWMDPDFIEGATLPDGTEIFIGDLVAQERDYTAAQIREVIEMHFALIRNVLPVHRAWMERGQIEVSTTPFYHPITPLLIDTEAMREAMGGATGPTRRFSYPGDAALHIERAAEQYEDIFGEDPVGMWPSEGSVSQAMLPLMAENGFEWFATDVQVLQRSLGRDNISAAERFSLWACDAGDGDQVAGIFRDTPLSDVIGFDYNHWNGTDAAQDFVNRLRATRQAILDSTDRPLTEHVIPVILDGENCWEAYEMDGKEFLHALYTKLVEDPYLQPVTISEALEQSGDLPQIARLHAGSWIYADFSTWIGEEEENRAWDLLADARAAFDTATFTSEADRERALDLLMIAEGSDWFWWYGDDQVIDNEQSFDVAFRGTLKQAYRAMGIEPPAALDEEIMDGAGPAGGGGVMTVGQRPE